jgi:hypothetical protein
LFGECDEREKTFLTYVKIVKNVHITTAMTHQNHQTNGASLEDCHTNFFALVSSFHVFLIVICCCCWLAGWPLYASTLPSHFLFSFGVRRRFASQTSLTPFLFSDLLALHATSQRKKCSKRANNCNYNAICLSFSLLKVREEKIKIVL